MKKNCFILFYILFLVNTAFSQNSGIDHFWAEFKNSVNKKDTATLVKMVDLSKTNGLIGKDLNEFYQNFGKLFDEKTIAMMANTKSLSKAENKEYTFIGGGAYKFFKFKKIKGTYKLYHVSYYD